MNNAKRLIAAFAALLILTLGSFAFALSGDVDQNGALGIKDAIMLCKAIAAQRASAADMLVMDVDADGRLTVSDLAYVCRAIMDDSVIFPRDADANAYSADVK